MAKKKKTEDEVRLALEDHCWINTPVAYTIYSKSFSLVQQDVMLQVSGKLQSHFSKFLNEQRYLNKEDPQSGIAAEDLANIEPIRLRLADLGISSNHYDEVVQKVNDITSITFRLPRFDVKTGLRKGDDYMPIFSKIFIPKSFATKEGNSYGYNGSNIKTDEEGKVISDFRRDGFVEVTINIEAAKAIFNMNRGYINHLERIAFFCNSVFTSRLYLLLMKYVSKGQMHPAIDYVELKDFLGMYERQPKSDVVVNEKYQKFSQFRKQVLNVARRDMERLCAENKIEIMLQCTAECEDGYEPLYKGTVKRGNPEKIRFHIKRTPLGVAREMEVHRGSSEQRLCDKIMERYPTLDEQRLIAFVADVPEDLWSDFKKYAYNGVPKAVESPHQWDGTPEEFIFYIMNQWVDSRKRKATPVAQQPDLFSQSDFAAPIPLVPVVEDYPGKYAEEWQTLMSQYDGALKPLLMQATHHGASAAGFMSIRFPDRKTLDAFNAECDKNKAAYTELMTLLSQLIGKAAARVLVRGVAD